MKTLEKISALAGKYFALLVILAAVIAYLLPDALDGLSAYVTILLGIVMFGMGLTLKPIDFKLVFTNPKPVVMGLVLQFTVMPIGAFLIAKLLNLPAELAAGLVLLGSVPGGTASNVMVYLARGNVALSVTMTSVSTLLAPIMTPILLLIFAGEWLPVDAVAMFMSIVQVIIIPIVLGLTVRRLFPIAVDKSVSAVPLISVFAILVIVMGVTAQNAENVVSSGFIVFFAVFLHNSFGLLLGYFIARMIGLNESTRRAMSLEVGMQNSGLAVTLASTHFTPLAALPGVWGAIWHNISGPIIATFWANKSADDNKKK